MFKRSHRLMLALLLALAAAGGAHAQSVASDSTVLPVWNKGKVEAVLLLEPTNDAAVGARMRFSDSTLDAAFGLSAGDSLGLLCDRKNGVASAIGNLINHCMLATFGEAPGGSRRASAGATLSRPGGKLGLSVGSGHDTLPAWLSQGKGGRVEQNDLTVFAQKNISREGFVTIRGTVARARLVPATEVPALADRWSTKSVSVGGGFGAFSGNIVGRVVDEPGVAGKWEGFGLGLTWRTPWSGQLTVGADNLVTRGRNPFGTNAEDDQGTIPYVRYEQDL
jgi:hypothetical protein